MWNKFFLIAILIGLKLSGFIVESIRLATLCKDISSKSIDLQLKTHLFCDYDPDVRPETSQKNATNVGLTVMPKIIEFDDDTNTLVVHCWTAVNWTDPHLIWNPKDFEGVDNLHVPSTDLWVPDITVHNSGDASEDQTGIPKTICGLSNDGGIVCIPAIKYKARCDADYTNYPYDVQSCTVELASWSYSSDEVALFLSHGVVMSDYTPNMEWKIIKFGAVTELHDFKMNETYASRIYILQFDLQRRAAGVHIIYVAPTIVLMVMTLSVLWLDCHSRERMIVACISFICHLICIQDLYWSIPHNGGILPNILRFYENSFLLMAFVLILTVLLRELHALTTKPPEWITVGTSAILQSKVGQLLLLSILDPQASAFLDMSADDNDDLVRAGKRDNTWSYVTLLIGWLAFLSVLFTYFIMLALYLPTSTSAGI